MTDAITSNEEQKKGFLQAAQTLTRSEHIKQLIKSEAKARKLKRKLSDMESDLTYEEHTRIKNLIENRKLRQAELALPKHL